MVKLIVSDIDGTLVNSKKEIPSRFWDVFRATQAKNIRFCVASGRQMQSLEQLFAPIADRVGFVSDNGAFVKFQGNELYEIPMNINEVASVLATCQQIESIGTVLCGKRKAYIKADSDSIFNEIVRHYPSNERVLDFSNIDDTIFKISVCDPKTSKLNSYPHLKKFSELLNVVISGELWLDVTDKKVNKGLALSELQRLWNISADETVVFGDQLNDLEMLQMAKFSFAMKNAQPEVKQVASFVTDYDNDNEGVVKQIEKILNQMA